MVTVAYGLTIILLVYGFLLLRKEKKEKVKSRIALTFQLERDIPEEPGDVRDELKKQSFTKRIIQPVWKRLENTFKRKLTNEKKAKIELLLIKAGNPFGMGPVEYRILQLSLFIILPVLFTLYGLLLNLSGGVIFLFIVVGLAIARYLPAFYLKQKTDARNKKAIRELPDFLDLLTVSIEAGLGFDSALSKVVSMNDGVLSREFQRCLEEMRLGKTRREALSGVRDRVMVDDIQSLIGGIIQAEKLGIGMSQMLNVQSLELREKRKQRAEEQAMKAPIKMLFPLVMFIFPCIFIVILGPVAINLIETLL